MQFERLPSPLDGVEVWGTVDDIRSSLVAFDHHHPEKGWRASWRQRGSDKVVYVGAGHASKKAAIQALIRELKNQTN